MVLNSYKSCGITVLGIVEHGPVRPAATRLAKFWTLSTMNSAKRPESSLETLRSFRR